MKKRILIFSMLLVLMLVTVTVNAAYQNFYIAGGTGIAQLSKYKNKASASTVGPTPDYYCYAEVTLSYFCPDGNSGAGELKEITVSRGAYREVFITAVAPPGTIVVKADSKHRCDYKKPAKATISSCTSHIEGTQKLQQTAKVQYSFNVIKKAMLT